MRKSKPLELAPFVGSVIGKPVIVDILTETDGKPISVQLEVRKRVITEARLVDGYSYTNCQHNIEDSISQKLLFNYLDYPSSPENDAPEVEWIAYDKAMDRADENFVRLAMHALELTKSKAEDVNAYELQDWLFNNTKTETINDTIAKALETL